MRTAITIILFILLNGCMGQYPKLHINEKGKVVGDTRYKGNDSPHADTFVNNKFYSSEGDTLFFYWSRYLFFSHESDKQKDIIKKQKNPSYKEYDRLMDSVVRYKKLIDGLKK